MADKQARELQYPSFEERAPAAPSNGLPGLPGDTGSGKLTKKPNHSRGLEHDIYSIRAGTWPGGKLLWISDRVALKLPTRPPTAKIDPDSS
jgi:hypothetical protein